jgi:hypothetical protein
MNRPSEGLLPMRMRGRTCLRFDRQILLFEDYETRGAEFHDLLQMKSSLFDGIQISSKLIGKLLELWTG